MQGDVKKLDYSGEEPEPFIGEEYIQAVAVHLEALALNPGQAAGLPDKGLDNETRAALALLSLPSKAAQDQQSVDGAWQRFRMRAFSLTQIETRPVEGSLGSYVAGTLQSGLAVKETGLPRETLEALQNDSTPLEELNNFELADYASLAKRYGIRENLFPRALKWLKGLGKNFSMPPVGSSAVVRFAREENYGQKASEEFLAAELEREETGSKVREEQAREE